MSKIIFTQEFDSFEEKSEFKIATQASDMYLAILDILSKLREYDKYGSNFKTPEEAIEKIREEVHEIIGQYNISME